MAVEMKKLEEEQMGGNNQQLCGRPKKSNFKNYSESTSSLGLGKSEFIGRNEKINLGRRY